MHSGKDPWTEGKRGGGRVTIAFLQNFSRRVRKLAVIKCKAESSNVALWLSELTSDSSSGGTPQETEVLTFSFTLPAVI